MTTLLETVTAFFNEIEWSITVSDDESAILTGYQGDNGEWPCLAWVNEEQQQLLFYSKCSMVVPENKRSMVAEYITRANFNLILGNFELDFTDGELRFKTSISVMDDRLTTALVRQVVIANVVMMDRYLPGAMKVIYGGITPEQAIGEVETGEELKTDNEVKIGEN